MMSTDDRHALQHLQLKVVELEHSRDALRRISLEQAAVIRSQNEKLDALTAMLAAPDWFMAEFGPAAVSEDTPADIQRTTEFWSGIAAALRAAGRR
ncbi:MULTISPECIES: hypothetical protein [unclassified Paenibacillus]|uniref:hypothetical protein n=1 Tax=unclassified Paenibacillus TaxID=185978 RepID=UPI0009552E5F|nr:MULTISPECIES: hypothetical protein [unclassified Paenibacillus]ASS65884.1 hypothetical protein CIC07_06815 [Paenibacillus sp. RUD330]SIQ20125.1 hypothetical protein SAMN05880555_0996 [Paenibacillus sp. RU4X]SIQ41766.1 hypothetical protein SAMN05880570_0995 [Paenibacillus sp. RU4T]